MPSFHWPRTSIHENMWNSKSCPEGLPHRKNGAMASRQTPANTNAREIGFLSKWPLAYLKPLISCRDAACRVSTGGRALRRRDEQFYCIRKFSEKLTGAKSFRRDIEVICDQRFFIQRITGPQQFQEWILGVGSVPGLVEVNGVGDERARRSFQLRSSAGLAGKKFDEVADALALLFCPGREFDAHAMSRVHDPDQTFGVNLHSSGAQAQVNGGGLRERRFCLHIAAAQTQVRQFTLAGGVGFFGQSIV